MITLQKIKNILSMKKIFLLLSFLLLLGFGVIYLLIPGEIKISSVAIAGCTEKEFGKCISNNSRWLDWLPESNKNKASVLSNKNFTYNNCTYHLITPLLHGLSFITEYENFSIKNTLEYGTYKQDSISVIWSGSFKASNNPVTRIKQYLQAVHFKKTTDTLLSRLTAFVLVPKNIYGFNIHKTSFENKFLIATKLQLNHNPSTNEIYQIIDELRVYNKEKNGIEIDHPMFHASMLDSLHYNIMIAIAIDREIEQNKKYFLVRMAHMDGSFVSADVNGGPTSIKKAHEEIENFMTDHRFSPPGIPFEVLITDRRNVSDTSKWVTTIYHPST
jgi:hypothetical protein